jgi:signal transduction histidine kinase
VAPEYPLNYRSLIWYTLSGMALGFFLVHPFAMAANTLDPLHPHQAMGFSLWLGQVRLAFSRSNLIMGAAFAFLGGAAGLALGARHLQKERWLAEKLESQRRLAALETLRELMVTLAHHIRNANVVIGGFSRRLQKRVSDPEMVQHLQMIRQASHEIEAVIASLENLSEIDHTPYTNAWDTRMINLKKELEARLATKAIKDQHES